VRILKPTQQRKSEMVYKQAGQHLNNRLYLLLKLPADLGTNPTKKVRKGI